MNFPQLSDDGKGSSRRERSSGLDSFCLVGYDPPRVPLLIAVRGSFVAGVYPLATFFSPLAALLLGLIGSPGTPPELPALAEVVVEGLEAFVEPEVSSLVNERLKKGERVHVIDYDQATGWVTINRPDSAFDYVERKAVRREGKLIGRIIGPHAQIRAGIPNARLPGPPRGVLPFGETVRLLDLPALVVRNSGGLTTWLAIVPFSGELRHIRAEGISWIKDDPLAAPQEVLTAFQASPDDAGGEVAKIEREHRVVLGEPVERWRLGGVKSKYEALLRRTSEPGAVRSIRARLELIAQQEGVARSARSFQAILERSRRRDAQVERTKQRLSELDRPQRRAFVAQGLVQLSSREVEGRRVYALIGRDGNPLAYLDVPPGLDASSVVAKRAGVRGSVHYNESLGARLIAVRDLEPLE